MKILLCAAVYLIVLCAEKKERNLTRKTCGMLLLALPLLLGICWWLGSTQSCVRLFLIALYLFWLAYADASTMHISSKWIVLSALFWLLTQSFPDGRGRLAGALLFSVPAFLLWKCRGWMGSADPWFLLLFGWILGLERMLICMTISLILAFGYATASRQRRLPFLTFLACGFFVSFVRGYSIYARLLL